MNAYTARLFFLHSFSIAHLFFFLAGFGDQVLELAARRPIYDLLQELTKMARILSEQSTLPWLDLTSRWIE